MIWLFVGFIGIIIIDFIPLVHYKKKSAIILFVVLFVFALTYNLLVILNVEITSILMSLVKLLRSIGISYPAV